MRYDSRSALATFEGAYETLFLALPSRWRHHSRAVHMAESGTSSDLCSSGPDLTSPDSTFNTVAKINTAHVQMATMFHLRNCAIQVAHATSMQFIRSIRKFSIVQNAAEFPFMAASMICSRQS